MKRRSVREVAFTAAALGGLAMLGVPGDVSYATGSSELYSADMLSYESQVSELDKQRANGTLTAAEWEAEQRSGDTRGGEDA